jgi:probable phosphoglycerate mutase
MTAKLLLIRHGRIRANTLRRWHGATDSPLTRLGRRQAVRLANHLRRRGDDIDVVVSSPLSRCRDTASEVARTFGRSLHIDDGLREFGVGELEDLSVGELHEQHDFFNRMQHDHDYAPPGGDSINAVAARIVPTLQQLGESDGAPTIAVVSHGAALAIAMASLLDANPGAWRNYHVDNCSITELRFVPHPEVGAFNQTSHL